MKENKAQITIDRKAEVIPTDYSWQFGIGNDHAFLLHRTDVCEHLKLAHDELGFRYLRCHGLFDDDMLTIQRLSDFRMYQMMPHLCSKPLSRCTATPTKSLKNSKNCLSARDLPLH